MSLFLEIKFRGKIDGRWQHVTPVDDGWGQFWALVDRETVGRFVGVKDYNGRDLYEGDIVEGESYRYGYELVGRRQFKYRGFIKAPSPPCWAWMIEDKNGGAWLLAKCVHRNSEWIMTGKCTGNIVDQPELISL